MNLEQFVKRVPEYFKGLGLEATANISEVEGVSYAETECNVLIKNLNIESRLQTLAYENGTSQVTFNLGEVIEGDKLYKELHDFNLRSFGLKAVIEANELRIYNQAFYESIDEFLNCLDMVLGLFLNPLVANYLKPLLDYLK